MISVHWLELVAIADGGTSIPVDENEVTPTARDVNTAYSVSSGDANDRYPAQLAGNVTVYAPSAAVIDGAVPSIAAPAVTGVNGPACRYMQPSRSTFSPPPPPHAASPTAATMMSFIKISPASRRRADRHRGPRP